MASLIDPLKTRYAAAFLDDMTVPIKSPLAFLHTLDAYMSFIDQEPILRRIVQTMIENEARESIEFARKLVKSTLSYRSVLHYIKDEEETPYPINQYVDLKEACERFKTVKSLSEEKIRATEIRITEKSDEGEHSSHSDGAGLLNMARYAYPKYLETLHAYLIEQLEWVAKQGVHSKYLDYDTERGILYFQGKEVRINDKKIHNNAHHLLSYLFSHEPFEQHFYDEMEDEKVLQQSRPWKTYYDACLMIQKKVASATGVDDFLDFSSGEGLYVRFNPEHSLKTEN